VIAQQINSSCFGVFVIVAQQTNIKHIKMKKIDPQKDIR
jgi:hypothetical protein